jgi:hypothetical protein
MTASSTATEHFSQTQSAQQHQELTQHASLMIYKINNPIFPINVSKVQKNSNIQTTNKVVKFKPTIIVVREYRLAPQDPYAKVVEDSIEDKQCKVQEVMQRARVEMISVLKQKCLAKPQIRKFIKFDSYTSPTMRITPDDNVVVGGGPEYHSIVNTHLKKVLIIESNESFLQHYIQRILVLFPNADIFAASNSQEAYEVLQLHSSMVKEQFPFDLVLVNHRLGDSSTKGSEIIHYVRHELNIEAERQPLLIGTSMNLKEDSFDLAKAGADMLWGVPPPRVCGELRYSILEALLDKRAGGESEVVIV